MRNPQRWEHRAYAKIQTHGDDRSLLHRTRLRSLRPGGPRRSRLDDPAGATPSRSRLHLTILLSSVARCTTTTREMTKISTTNVCVQITITLRLNLLRYLWSWLSPYALRLAPERGELQRYTSSANSYAPTPYAKAAC